MKPTTVLTDVSAPGVAASVGPGDEPLHLLTLHHHHLAILSSPDSLHSTCFPLHHSPTKAPFHRDVLTSLVDDQVNMYPTASNLHNQAVRTCEGREEREKGGGVRERDREGDAIVARASQPHAFLNKTIFTGSHGGGAVTSHRAAGGDV